MIGNAHLDVAWLWTCWEGLHEVRATFRSALDRMAEFEDFHFSASSASYYEWIERTEYSPDLYAGAAGIGLFLAELARATGEERYADAARGAARWIAGPHWGRGRAQHGFHGGEAGIAFFFLRLAALLETPGYVAAAAMRLRRLRGAAWVTTDLMYGTAGSILGQLAMHAVTGEREFLAEARMLGDQLVGSAIKSDSSEGCYWEIASVFAMLSLAFDLDHGS